MYKSWNRGYLIAHLVNPFVRTPRINPDFKGSLWDLRNDSQGSASRLDVSSLAREPMFQMCGFRSEL